MYCSIYKLEFPHGMPENKQKSPKISIVLPCKNEELALQRCLDEIKGVIAKDNLDAEVIVVDNGSTDGSRKILGENLRTFSKLKIINESNEGYGLAYLKGFETARGEYIFMADADGTYSFKDIPKFLEEIKKGNDLVVGNRFASSISRESMSFLRKAGNAILSLITRLLFKIKIKDIHSGARMITRQALSQITLYTAGMEFASEMIIKAKRRGLKISELSVSYRPRFGESKLRAFRDGWRHLRFLLLYSPLFLFLLPGLFLFLAGILSMTLLFFFNIQILGLEFYFHPMFLSSLLILVGYQLVFFAGFAKVYAVTHLGDEDRLVSNLFKYITIEKAGVLGIVCAGLGGLKFLFIFWKWVSTGFGSLDEIKSSIVAMTFVVFGVETIFSAFMLSMLGIKER